MLEIKKLNHHASNTASRKYVCISLYIGRFIEVNVELHSPKSSSKNPYDGPVSSTKIL